LQDELTLIQALQLEKSSESHIIKAVNKYKLEHYLILKKENKLINNLEQVSYFVSYNTIPFTYDMASKKLHQKMNKNPMLL
jgi:hypothetical protein